MRDTFKIADHLHRKPIAYICNMHKPDPRFFSDNREISNFAVKGVPFSAIFVGTYERTNFHTREVSPMIGKARRGKNTKQPVSVHRLKKDAFASTESIRILSRFLWLPHKN